MNRPKNTPPTTVVQVKIASDLLSRSEWELGSCAIGMVNDAVAGKPVNKIEIARYKLLRDMRSKAAKLVLLAKAEVTRG